MQTSEAKIGPGMLKHVDTSEAPYWGGFKVWINYTIQSTSHPTTEQLSSENHTYNSLDIKPK